MEFKDRLRMLRKEKGLTQKQLGEMIGVGRTTISEYENGKIVPRQDGLVRLAELLNTSIDFLTGATSYTTDGDVFQLDESMLVIMRAMKRKDTTIKYCDHELNDKERFVVLQQMRTTLLMLNEFSSELC